MGFDDNKKIGIGCCGLGCLCLFLGLLMGKKVVKFFFRREKWKGTSAFFLGIAVIIVGWPFFGFLIEMYGVWKLFAAFLPSLVSSMQYTVPGASAVMNTRPISLAVNAIKENRRLPV